MSLLEYYISALSDKHGRRILPILEDMRTRDKAILICSFGGDDPDAPICAHLLDQHGLQIALGIKHLADAGSCCEIIIYAGMLDVGAVVEQLSVLTGIKLSVKTGPASPVLREPTALYTVIDTGMIWAGNAEEEYQRTYLSYGYHGRPTLVVDAETAYQANCLFDSSGEPMTKHIAIIDQNPEITEVPVGTTLEALLDSHAISKPVLTGGMWGSYINLSDMQNTRVRFNYHFDSVRILGSDDCVVSLTAELYTNIHEISCAKCVLCREGSWQIQAIFKDITEGKASRDDLALLEDICSLIRSGALCDYGKNMIMPALTSVYVYRDELSEHIVGKNCAYGKCKGLQRYLIDPALCSGCGECLNVCPEDAIEGQDGFIHMIDEKLCTKCGKCRSICPEKAIKFGGERIKVPKKLVRVGRFH